jgi:hypothetical protein
MNNTYIIAAIIVVALGVYFFVYKRTESFEEDIKSPNVLNIEFPNEGLIGAFIAPKDYIPTVKREPTSDPTIFSLTSTNSFFYPKNGKKVRSVFNTDGSVAGFLFKLVNKMPTSQY